MATNNVLVLNTLLDTRTAEKDLKKFRLEFENSPLTMNIDIDLKNKTQRNMKDFIKSLQNTLDNQKIQLNDNESLALIKNLIKEEETLANAFQSTREKAEQLLKTQQELQTTESNITSFSQNSTSAINGLEKMISSLIKKVQQFQKSFEELSSGIANSDFSSSLADTGSDLETVSDKLNERIDLFSTLLSTLSDAFSAKFDTGISNEKYALSSCKGTDAQTQKCWENNKNYYLATA